jgi:hypothetical protein
MGSMKGGDEKHVSCGAGDELSILRLEKSAITLPATAQPVVSPTTRCA